MASLLRSLTIIVYALVARPAVAAETAMSRAEPSPWSAAAHIGFGVVDQSTTGFERVTGSLFLVDLTHNVAPSIDLGVRSIGIGGRRDEREYYRLGTGPLVSWRINRSWTLQAMVGVFQETGMTDGDELYRSRGKTALVGWERAVALTPRLDLAWGGFVGFHSGDMAASIDPSPSRGASAARLADANRGQLRGLELALRFRP